MKRKEKIYQIQYILSNGKTIVHGGKREKVIKEWEEVLKLSAEEIIKFLKLSKGKDKDKNKDVVLVEMILIDWVGTKLVGKVVDKEDEDIGNEKDESKEL